MRGVKGLMAGLCALALLFLALPALGEGFPQSATVATGSGKLNLRLEPDKKARLAGRLGNGQAVTVLDERDGWYLIAGKGLQGWAMAEYVALVQAQVQAQATEAAPPFSGQVFIRQLPDEFSKILYTAPGAEVTVTARAEGWYSVRCDDGAGGEFLGYAKPAGPMGVGAASSLAAPLAADAVAYRLPDEGSGAAGVLPAGQTAQISELGPAWCLVEAPVAGYVKTALLALSPGSGKAPAGEEVLPEEEVPEEAAFLEEAPPETPAPPMLSRQAALARAFAALKDRYLLADGWEGGLTVQVTQVDPQNDGPAEPRFLIGLIGEDGCQTGQVLLNAYTGEVVSMFFEADPRH